MIPQLIAASAKLKIGLKNIKCSPPTNGIHVGEVCIYNRKVKHIHHFSVKP